jgi:cob(I)alamin adenosyltransferase
MVRLTRIYTRTGDAGRTRLGDFSETVKTDPRVAAYGDVNEANAHVGVAIELGGIDSDVVDLLKRVQNDLFDVGADLSTPVVSQPEFPPLRVLPEYVGRLEGWCDEYNEPLQKLTSFILPSGSPGAALLHAACTSVRRAERSTWSAIEAYGDGINPVAAQYLNRLSDLLFILARYANREVGDVLWKAGGTDQTRPT